MIRRLVLPILAVAGLALAIAAVRLGNRALTGQEPETDATDLAPKPPYASYVAGAGLVEAEGGDVAIGTPVAGIVEAIDVTWGQWVAEGASLFEIDARDLESRLPPARARIDQAKATLDRASYLFDKTERLHGDHLVSDEELAGSRFDLADARAALATRRAELAELEAEIDRRTVRAPIAGRVLEIDVRVGERVESGPGAASPMTIGADDRLAVRVMIDENDAWRLAPEAPARAFVRGNPALATDLRFERIEPVAVPKRSLTGGSTERTDTRVLEVLYSFERGALPVQIGEQVDVFIEAPPGPSPPAPGASAERR